MKLISCIYRDTPHLGVLQEDHVILPALDAKWNTGFGAQIRDMLSLIESGGEGLNQLSEQIAGANERQKVDAAEIHWQSPIPKPRENVICLGWNYRAHVTETTGADVSETVPRSPIIFTKSTACVVGPYDDIPYAPEVSDKMDWEAELGVVIGSKGYQVKKEEALDHVFGYTVINDITARDLQKWHKQFYIGKSLPASCPIGPCIVTADEIPDPQALMVSSKVNGELKQKASTATMIFDIATIIETLSKTPGVQPGNIIATGTPEGVGYVRKPPQYLQPGDVVECAVEKIGKICNTIVVRKE